MLNTIWLYVHEHWQDNVLASVIYGFPAYLYGRHHVKKIHKRLDSQDDKTQLIHNDIKKVHKHIRSKL